MDSSGKIVIGTELDTSEFDSDYKELQDKMNDYLKQLDNLKAQKEMAQFSGNQEWADDVDFKIEKINNHIEETSRRINDINAESKEISDNAGVFTEQLGMATKNGDDLDKVIERTGRSLKKAVLSIKNTTLAIFGIRSVFSFIRSSMSTIASNDAQLKADLDYIKTALAYTIEPIIRTIVEWAKQILQYVGYIIYKWTGNNIFEKANQNLEKANKQMKELKNSVSGFDELNIIKEESTESTKTQSSLAKTSVADSDQPTWIKVLAENPGLLTGLAGGLLAVKLGLEGVKAIGFGFFVAGVTDIVRGIKNFAKDPSVKNFGTITRGIGESILGIGLMSKNLPMMLIGLGIEIVGIVMENWDEIKEILGKVGGWIYDNLIKPIGEMFATIGAVIGGKISEIWDGAKRIISGAIENIGKMLGGLATSVGQVFTRIGGAISTAFNSVSTVVKKVINGVIWALNKLIDGVNLIAIPLRGLIVGIGYITGQNWSMNDVKIPNIPYLAKGGIVNNPGKGVMMGSYVAGERGKEGVIPLEDPMAMEELGLAIGKNVIINLTNINKLDNKTIGKETKKLTNDMLFLRNGGVA